MKISVISSMAEYLPSTYVILDQLFAEQISDRWEFVIC